MTTFKKRLYDLEIKNLCEQLENDPRVEWSPNAWDADDIAVNIHVLSEGEKHDMVNIILKELFALNSGIIVNRVIKRMIERDYKIDALTMLTLPQVSITVTPM